MTDEQTKETIAASVFAGFLTLALGGAGLIIAALAVGVERAWNGRTGADRRDGGGWRDHWQRSLASHQAWLGMDRQRRHQWHEQRRLWWVAGADPAARPDRPPVQRARRTWARLYVFADRAGGALQRFIRGFRDGWGAANARRRELDAEPAATGAVDRLRAIAGARPTSPADQAPAPSQSGQPTTGTDAPTSTDHNEPTDPSTAEVAAQPQVPEEAPMPAPTTAPTTAVNGSAPQGETNLDLTALDLAEVQRHLTYVTDLSDQLAAARAALQDTLSRASERVAATGGTADTAAALDAARQVAAQISQHIGDLSQATVEASDATNAAATGLAPAQDAQDALAAAGARGEFVSTATTD